MSKKNNEITRFMLEGWKKKVFSLWLLLVLAFLLIAGSKEMRFSTVGVIIAALPVLIIWKYKEKLSNILKNLSTKKRFIIIGSIGAIWVELEFWIIERITGANLTANPNLFLDLLITMPWYVIMMAILWKVQTKYRYSNYTIFIYGGIYDLFADGILKVIMNTGGVNPTAIIMLLIGLPAFALCYSAIVLPPNLILQKELEKKPGKEGLTKYAYALLPLAALIIYMIIITLLS